MKARHYRYFEILGYLAFHSVFFSDQWKENIQNRLYFIALYLFAIDGWMEIVLK